MTTTTTAEGPAPVPREQYETQEVFLIVHCGKNFLSSPVVLPLDQLPTEQENNQPVRRIFGRSTLAALQLNDTDVSRRHFALWQRGDQNRSQIFLEDLGSRNGTYVDGDPLPFSPQNAPHQLQDDLRRNANVNRAEVRDGARIRCGNTILIFRRNFPKNGQAEAPLVVSGGEIVSPFGLRRLRQELAIMEQHYQGSRKLGQLNLLLQAETGSGKELLARYVAHRLGRDQPFVATNIRAIAPTLLSAELFGIENLQGAQPTRGLVGASHGGTLFLDEIHLLDPSVQGSLLRFLEEHRDYQRVGSTRTLHGDVLVITATSQDLRKFVGDDLRSRLEYVKLKIPPLRERVEDIPELSKAFLIHRGISVNQLTTMPVEVELMEALLLHPWREGNARELRNMLERLLQKSGRPELRRWAWNQIKNEQVQEQTAPTSLTIPGILRALEETRQPRGYNYSEAAKVLAMDDTTLRRWLGRIPLPSPLRNALPREQPRGSAEHHARFLVDRIPLIFPSIGLARCSPFLRSGARSLDEEGMKNIWVLLVGAQAIVACTTVQVPGGGQGGSPPGEGGSQGGGQGGSVAAGSGGSGVAGTGSGAAGESPTGAGGGSQGGSGNAGASGGTGGSSGSGGNLQGGTGGQSAGGSGGKAGAGGGVEEPPEGPCGKVPEEGICLDKSTLQRCLVLTGQGKPQLVTQTCPFPKVCTNIGGEAKCFLEPSLCEPGSSKCLSPNTQGICNDAGQYISSPCPGCKDSAIGPTCQTTSTTKLSGALDYEVRAPNEQFNDWGSTKYLAHAQGLLAVSWHKKGNSYEALDSTLLDSKGGYSIQIASPPDPDDIIVFYAVRPSSDGKSASFAVAKPMVSNGEQDAVTFLQKGQGDDLWSWSAYVQDVLQSPGGKLTITEDIGSGAVYLFDYLRYAHEYTEYLTGKPGKSLVAWIRPNTSWSCGACYLGQETRSMYGLVFESQILIPATKQDESYWSAPVHAHELGHWVMDSYGTPPGEGGPHTLNCPTYPGQAWSEGWATGFSSLARASSIYYDKQQGSFFWLDIAPTSTFSGSMWPKPSKEGGLYQQMAENEVAGILWSLAVKPVQADEYLGTSKFLLDALRSSRMNQAPFLRGYQQHRWDIVPGSCQKINVFTYANTAPMLADYLDALACSGVSPSAISNALKAGQPPGFGYPYNPTAPLCL
ncbi:MAG: sigma 54-interacting transcriptional regulator [Myxococcales bacterium]|nr:sigma 54-interacting transcriptional regulator [Polyangiaceae bacterium]MDW8251087.1 sigma 54-interacting transcriptional regulator [Myxococcales bacterium]